MSKARRRLDGEEDENGNGDSPAEEAASEQISLSEEQFDQLSAQEEFILTATENGYGKRTSAYEYRITKRGGQGVVNIATEGRNGAVVASFPVNNADQIMLVTDGGKIIRSPVADIRIAGRSTQGVTLFDTADDEKVVSVAYLQEPEEDVEVAVEVDTEPPDEDAAGKALEDSATGPEPEVDAAAGDA